MKIIIQLIIFQIFLLFRYFEKWFDAYPIEKKKRIEAIEAPKPNIILSFIKKLFEKLPKKNTVSE